VIPLAAQKTTFGVFQLCLTEVRAFGFNVALLVAQPAALFGLVEGAVVTLFLGAPSAVGAVHVVGFHADIAGLTVPICLTVHRGTFPTPIAVKVPVGRAAVTLLAVFIALFHR